MWYKVPILDNGLEIRRGFKIHWIMKKISRAFGSGSSHLQEMPTLQDYGKLSKLRKNSRAFGIDDQHLISHTSRKYRLKGIFSTNTEKLGEHYKLVQNGYLSRKQKAKGPQRHRTRMQTWHHDGGKGLWKFRNKRNHQKSRLVNY